MKDKETSTILIVDDDKQVLRSLQIWFKNEGFEPVVASNGEEAVKILQKTPIDVALVDLRMSKEDGIAVAGELKKIDEELKIVIMTGFPSYETAVNAMKVGIYDYISKGSSNEKIMGVIKKAVDEKNKTSTSKTKQIVATKDRISFILFCGHSLIKERLENLSKTKPEFSLVKSYPSLENIKNKAVSQEVEIALVCANCNLKTFEDCYEVFPELYRAFPGVKPVIINETFTDEEKVELLKLGIRGFFSRDLSSEKLERAIRHVKKGEIWVSRNVTNLSLKDMANQKTMTLPPVHSPYGLTDREVDILRTMALGLKNQAIADKLFISEKTVKTHINRIFKKLDVANRTQAILTAIEKKVI